jgi:RHS repeat-associated protein
MLNGLAALAIVMPASVWASDEVAHEARGHERSGYSLSDYETINLANGNLSFRVPLWTVHTDGGLAFELALGHDSKVWHTHRYCTVVYDGYESCEGAGGAILEAQVAYGVEAYGFGWDLRPPRLVLARTSPHSRQTAYLDATGARHGVSGTPPWLMGDGQGGEVGGEWAVGDRFYTRDGSNHRFTVTQVDGAGRALRVEMEDGDGDLHIFAHVVPIGCDSSRRVLPTDLDLSFINFRVETAGLYLSEIQRGPWRASGPANRISFEYAAPSAPWMSPCSPNRPWLLKRVTASGEAPRSVEIGYDPGTGRIARVLLPAFNPVLGDNQPSAGREEIRFTLDARSFEQRNASHLIDFTAVHLTEIRFPDGASFRFDELLLPDEEPLADVVLPSGGRVEYGRGPFPVGRGRCEDAPGEDDDCRFWLTCGAAVPRVAGTHSTNLYSEGVTSRTLSYQDAATEGGQPRRETTWFQQGLNCAVSPQFARPSELRPWPYNFDWALRDAEGLIHPEYLWTVVYTAAGAAGPSSQGVAEIHRFHPLTREEFSVDVLAGDSDELAALPLWALIGVEDLTGPGLRVLRHTEIDRELRYGLDYPSIVFGDDRYSYIRERRVLTDEASGDSTVADVESCSPPVFADPLGPPIVTVDCAELRETVSVDSYLNPYLRTLSSLRSVPGAELSRTWETSYRVWDAETSWFLHRDTAVRVCEGAGCSYRTRTWLNLSQSGSRKWFVPHVEVRNPGAGGGCTADCLRETSGYDALGNRELATVGGGYGTGFGALTVTTRTGHRHGRPVRRQLESGGASLLRWQREVDAGTGLVRWHLAGNGSGFAYGYDAAGRLTELAPVEGDLVGGEWWLELPRSVDGATMVGSHLERGLPETSELLRHELHDSAYDLVPAGGGRRLEAAWVDPDPSAAVDFDGLGRITRQQERYPSGSGVRTRLSLDLYRDGVDPCGTGQGTSLEHTSRIALASEWRDEAEWSSCADLDWTETRYDPLGRPSILRLPDGSESFLAYVGDSQRTVLRSVATDPAGGQQWLATISLEDGLGRLRALDEELAPGSVVSADYGYDREDRLVAARLWEGAPGASASQSRSWSYSSGGFLTAATEPERSTSYLGWDALGNLRSSRTASTTTTVGFDAFGRRSSTTVAGLPAASWLWGDARPVAPAAPGDPDYGAIVEATQHNRFGSQDVPVTTSWTHGGPGGRIDARAVAIGGVGSAGDGLSLSYAYDRWGNPSRIDHPQWSAWPTSCQEVLHEERSSEGSWLSSADARLAGSTTATAGALRSYHATGRVARTDYQFEGDTYGRLIEIADLSGMARPRKLELWWAESPTEAEQRWAEGTFSYDGAGNVKRIGARRFAYDGLDRLVAFHEGGSPMETYAWDRWGNLTELVNTDTGHGGGFTLRLGGATTDNRPEQLTVPGVGSATLGWSARGNLTSLPTLGPLRAKQLTFSNEDRLLVALDSSSGTRWRHAYDAAGERVASWRRTAAGQLAELRLFVRDEAASVLSEWLLLPGSDFGPARDYLRAGDRVVAQLDWTDGQPSPRFLAHDHLGSTRVLITPDSEITDRIEYEPFGAFRSGGPVPGASHLFTGHERDLGTGSSELDSMHARYYSPALARFVSVDTVGGDPSSSQSWNRYSYTRGNPLRAVDPTGLYEEDVHRLLTHYLALQAGRAPASARAIAQANQAVDEEHPATPLDKGSFGPHFMSLASAVDLAQQSSGDVALGAALHSVQDAFAHEGYGYPLGHARDNVAGHSPDDPANDPVKAMRMAEMTFELLGGDPKSLDKGFLEMLFRTASEADRKKMLDEAINGPDPDGVLFTVTRGAHMKMIADYYVEQGYEVRIDGVPYYGN